MPTEPPSMRVLFVAGHGRSGSTLVANVLGSLPGFVSVGELRYLWERGLGEQSLCGCGRPVTSCEFWAPVLETAYDGAAPDVARVVTADRHLLRVRAMPRLLGPPHVRRSTPPAADEIWYVDQLGRVLRALSQHTGGATIVDSSKLVTYGAVLSRVPGIDLRVLHLVRDARGVAHSWSRRRDRPDRGQGAWEMGRESPIRSAVLWDLWNVSAERLWGGLPGRYVRVRYEDVTRAPAETLTDALRRLGFDGQVTVTPDGALPVDVAHTVAGNPGRMTSGAIAISRDDEWVTRMPTARRALVTLSTAPLLHHYGYPMRGRAPAAEDHDEPRVFVEDLRGLRRLTARVRRNVTWVRQQGVARALEEKEIDPVRTVPARLAKRRYRRRSGSAGRAVPVYVVGVQRSGTNMLVRGFDLAPEFEVHNENDGRAFDRFKLRSDDVIASLVAASRHDYVMFKPLCDSHRVDHLLDDISSPRPGRAVWAYRDVEGRVRSALAKFGDGNLQVLREFASGANITRWHTQRISAASAELVRSFDYDRLSPASGAALMWLIRNRLYFELGLDQRPDVRLVSYNAFLDRPDETMQGLCRFLGFRWRPELTRHVSRRPPTYRQPLDIEPEILGECAALVARLDAAAAAPTDPASARGPVTA
ncbi:MAG: sulfotransferase [Actinomycetales bacterium]